MECPEVCHHVMDDQVRVKPSQLLTRVESVRSGLHLNLRKIFQNRTHALVKKWWIPA